VRWPKSDSCLLPASLCKSPGRCSLPTEAVSGKRQFTQPHCWPSSADALRRRLFAKPRYALSEHRELRQVLGLLSVPDFTTLYRFLQRLDDQTIDRALAKRCVGCVARCDKSGKGPRCRGRHGLAQGAVSTFFCARMHHTGRNRCPGALAEVVVPWIWISSFVFVATPRRGPWNDCANLPAVVEAASSKPASGWYWPTRSSTASANHTYIRQRLGAQSVIPATRKENLVRARSARRDATCLPATNLPPPRPDREPFLR